MKDKGLAIRACGFYWTTWSRAQRDEPQIREWVGDFWSMVGTWELIDDAEIAVIGDRLLPP